MNDRFKFRVWNKPGNSYISAKDDADFVYLEENGKITVGLYNGDEEDMLYLKEEDLIVEQCTGLKDKNGKLIYEGDIVCWTRAQSDGDVDSICPVIFDKDMCSFGPLLNGHSLWMPHQTDLCMKVIGNIHENPELLEQTNEH